MNYGIWADIFMEHEYVGGRCEDFTFRPDPPTAETMKHEGIMMRETAGGFRLIADEAAFSHEISLVFSLVRQVFALLPQLQIGILKQVFGILRMARQMVSHPIEQPVVRHESLLELPCVHSVIFSARPYIQ